MFRFLNLFLVCVCNFKLYYKCLKIIMELFKGWGMSYVILCVKGMNFVIYILNKKLRLILIIV